MLSVKEICIDIKRLGSFLTIGFKCDEKISKKLIRTAYDNGINFFDTANAYNNGKAEKMLGKCLKDYPRSSKYLPGKPAPKGSRASDPDQNAVIMNLYWNEGIKKKSQEFAGIAKQMGVTAAQLAIAWCLRRPEVTSVILGARKVQQFKENLKAARIKVPQEVIEKLDKLYPPVGEIPAV